MSSSLIVNIRYPEFDEPLRATHVGKSLVRLDEPSVHVPLTESDVVAVTADGIITGVVWPAPFYVVEAFLPLMCEDWMLEERLAKWSTATLVVQTSPCNLRVRSASFAWLTDVVEGDPEVELMLTLRRPGEFLDLRRAVEDATGIRGGE
jgi:hypothetical protein